MVWGANNHEDFMRHARPRIPIFFKLWFAFVALIAVCILSLIVYVGVSVVQAGPEGIGKAIGSFIKSVDEGRR